MTTPAIAREFREIPIGLIDRPSDPSRSAMDDQKLDELTRSILAIGLMNPISVARVGERYEVIAGDRRYHACSRAGYVAIPCIVYPEKTAATVALQFAENYAREELGAADEAIWFSELLDTYCGGDVDVLADRLKVKRSYVENRLLLFRGDEIVFEALQREQIKIGVAHELNKVTDERMRRYFLDSAVRGGATESIVRGWVHQWKLDTGAAAAPPAPIVTSDAPAPVPEPFVFRCCVCNGTEHVHLMRQVNVHDYCNQAVLQKLLASYRGDGS